MSRPPRKPKKVESDDEEAHATSSATKGKPKKGGAAASSTDDFPKLDFDMGDLEEEIKNAPPPKTTKKGGDAEEEDGGDGEEEPSEKPKKGRFPTRPPPKEKPSRESSTERGTGSHIVKMEELDRWRWATKYSEEGDQDEIRLAENLKQWSKVQLPDQDTTDVAAAFNFRKFLWKNKKLCRDGIPPQFRLFVWEVLSGAKAVPDRLEHANRYQYYLTQIDHLSNKQHHEIAQDIPRALNAHPKFVKSHEGQEELRRVLSAFAVRSPSVGYVTSLSHIAAFFLLYYQEEQAFWILAALIDIVLPPDYFSQSLLGVRADCMLMKLLVFQRFPKLHQHFTELGVDVFNIALKWLHTIYLLCLSKECIARILDVLFLEGSNILISVGLSFFFTHEKELLKIDDLMETLTTIGKLGNEITDNDELMRVILKESKCKLGEDEDKRRQIERQVMENDYIKELQKVQLHRKLEDAKHKEEAAAKAKREKEEDDAVAMGLPMYKIGSYGEAKLTTVSLEKIGGEWFIQWKSKRKKDDEAQMKISDCSLHFGLRHGNFAARPEFQKKFQTAKKMAFSLISATRSLDLVCQTTHDMEAMRKVFYRPGFPIKNSGSIQAFRRHIEKKKTLKRIKLAAAGKTNVKIESSDDDYDESGDELEDDAEEKENHHSSSTAAASSSSSSTTIGRKKPSASVESSSENGTKKKPLVARRASTRDEEED